MSDVNTPAVAVGDPEKAHRVFTALAAMNEDGTRPRLRMVDIAEQTGLSVAQARSGWTIVRGLLGQLAVMEPHREHSVYFLTDNFDDGLRYAFWQSRHVYARICSERETIAAIRANFEHHPDLHGVLTETEANLHGAWANMRQLLRTVGVKIGVDTGEIARILGD